MTRLPLLCILLSLSLIACDSGGDDGPGNGGGNGDPTPHTITVNVDGAPATVHTVTATQLPGGLRITAADTVTGRRTSLVLPDVQEGMYRYEDSGVSLSYQSGDGSDPAHFFRGVGGEVVITQSNAEQITGSFDISADNASNGASKRLLLTLAGSFVLEADGFNALVTDDLDKGVACFLTEHNVLSTTGIPWSTANGGFFLPVAQEHPETGEIMSMGFNAQTFGQWYDLQHNTHRVGPPGDPYDISLSLVLSGPLVPQRRYSVGLVEDSHILGAVLTVNGSQGWQYRADAQGGGGSVYIQHVQRDPTDGETRIEGSFDLTFEALDGSARWAVCDGGSFWMTLN